MTIRHADVLFRPFRARHIHDHANPGRCPGLSCRRPFGAYAATSSPSGSRIGNKFKSVRPAPSSLENPEGVQPPKPRVVRQRRTTLGRFPSESPTRQGLHSNVVIIAPRDEVCALVREFCQEPRFARPVEPFQGSCAGSGRTQGSPENRATLGFGGGTLSAFGDCYSRHSLPRFLAGRMRA
jgi:hypothetical protein